MTLSVVVPTLNEARHIEACLASVWSQPHDGEVIVVDGGSDDATAVLATPLATAVVPSVRGRAAQMNAGARTATGDALLFLHADSRLAPGAFDALHEALADPAVVGGTFTLRFDVDDPLLDFYAWCTRFPLGVFRYGDQGIFVRRATFDALGGFPELPIMEDVDFLARLRRRGRTALIPLPVTTSARRFERLGVVRQQLLNAALVGLYALGAPPERLARWYENVHR